MTGLYDEMCNLFIKPARQTYSDYDLGPFTLGNYGVRQNFSFQSHKGYEIKTSFFKNKNRNHNTCIIYLHSFNGSRLQSLRYASQIVEKCFHFCSFDFAGCGNSAGQYVSLGCNQKWDVLQLIEQLKIKYGLTQYFIWGRSMGAVTAIKFYSLLAQQQRTNKHMDICILGLVLDSAFISLKRMVVQVGKNRLSIPQFLIKAVLLVVRSSIEQKGQFKFDDLELEPDIESIRCSTLLLASKEDTFVQYLHSQQIFSKLKLHDNKEIQYTRGEHYQSRDQKTINSIYNFFDKKLKKYNDILSKMNYLRESRTNGISRIKDFSIEKHTKSLRKYEPKVSNAQNNPKQKLDYDKSSNKMILIRTGQENGPKSMQSTQFHGVGSEKKIIPQKSCELVNKQYQTQKKIGQPHINFLISSSKEAKHKNQLQNKSKPNLFYQIGQISSIKKKQKDFFQMQVNKSTERTLQLTECQQNHCNIISDKLRKKTKPQRQRHMEIDDQNEISKNRDKLLHQKPKAKIKFIMSSQVSTPIHMHQKEKSTKKPSMTAQQYKNSQIKIIKGIVTLSPNIKKRQQKTSCADLTIKESQELNNIEQCKSMNNLISLGQHNRNDSYSSKNLNPMKNLQPNQQKTK